jgi:hypothetical protein
MQAMSVQQLLQSPKATSAKGEVVTDKDGKQVLLEGLLSNGKTHSGKNVSGKSSLHSLVNNDEQGEENGEIDFSSLLAEAKTGETKAQGLLTPSQKKTELQTKSGNDISVKVANTTSSLDQLLNNLKGTEDQTAEQSEKNGEPVKSLKNESFPSKKTENENPLEFLVKNSKEKNISSIEIPVAVNGEKSDLQTLMESSGSSKVVLQKNELIPNKITNPVFAEKSQNQEQAVKVLSGEDFVKNLLAANPQTKSEKSVLNAAGEKLDKKQIAQLANNIPQIKNYGKGQNILNDSMIRNTNDLAFKDVKKLKTAATDELRSPELKTAGDLAMIKESPISALQLKASPVQENKIQPDVKVLDLSHIDAKNTNEIIKTISDYVEQNKVANKSSLDLVVKHETLGQFNIQVSKGQNQNLNQIDMQITTSSAEGHKFFVANEASLMKNLQQSGVNLSDLRIISSGKEATPFSQSESKQFSSFQHEQNGDSKQFMSFESGDFREGSQKRKSLWDEYQERYGA